MYNKDLMKYVHSFLVVFFIFNFFFLQKKVVFAATVAELQSQIQAKQQESLRLEAENIKLQIQIAETNKEARTLQNAVRVLDTTSKKLSNDISATQNNIGSTELVIEKTTLDITSTESRIEKNKLAIAQALQSIRVNNDKSFIEALLQYETINELWSSVESLGQFQASLKNFSDDLRGLKTNLETQKEEKEQKKQELEVLKTDLVDRNSVIAQNKAAKAKLLTQTKNQEADYKKLLAANIELGRKFQQELFQFESDLKIQIDTSKLPTEQSSSFTWPLSRTVITQRFGRTSDSGRLYVSGTHNGVDFGTSVGSQVKTVGVGVVSGVGNTDDQPGCFSYGRWILIKHPNGLSSLYAHLSASRVTVGDPVTSGQVIGLSGGQPGASGSGFSTGPHLHLGIFATQGVSVQRFSRSNFCKQVSIPIAATNAYLDPLVYLPPLN
jgi:murein DD-endopeptidase MepM/ murein hydrolase activator NlpD